MKASLLDGFRTAVLTNKLYTRDFSNSWRSLPTNLKIDPQAIESRHSITTLTARDSIAQSQS